MDNYKSPSPELIRAIALLFDEYVKDHEMVTSIEMAIDTFFTIQEMQSGDDRNQSDRHNSLKALLQSA